MWPKLTRLLLFAGFLGGMIVAHSTLMIESRGERMEQQVFARTLALYREAHPDFVLANVPVPPVVGVTRAQLNDHMCEGLAPKAEARCRHQNWAGSFTDDGKVWYRENIFETEPEMVEPTFAHETVHYLQALRIGVKINGCIDIRAREIEAYTLTEKYIAQTSGNLQLMMIAMSNASAYAAGQCPQDHP